jgi:vancomycin resistance protein YoaR
MPFEPEFKKHLHSLMVEVYEKTIDETEQHKREILFKARETHNTAATPIAYKDAALHAMEFRLSRTIEKYVEAVAIWGYSIDSTFEADMHKEFWSLTGGPNQLQFPPAIRGQHVQAVQGAYARERQRLAARLVREGSNRLRELKMKTMQAKRTAEEITNNTFNGPVGNAYINSSVVQTTNNIAITTQILDDIDLLSEGHSELQSAALEIRNAQAKGTSIVDKFRKWAESANTVGGLAEKIRQYYPNIIAVIEHFKHAKP